jgi:hypothetical protein
MPFKCGRTKKKNMTLINLTKHVKYTRINKLKKNTKIKSQTNPALKKEIEKRVN